MEIYSRFGVGEDVKLFNDEPVTFFARLKGDEGGEYLRNVGFFLVVDANKVDLERHGLFQIPEKTSRWGVPISTFSLPRPKSKLPAGSYRLLAKKRGYKGAEIGVVQAYLRYFDLDVIHEKDRYLASLRFRLDDTTEKRKSVPLKVRIETAAGRRLDGTERRLNPVKDKPGIFRTSKVLRISSLAKVPKGDKPVPPGRSLRVEPGCSLVVMLGEVRIAWPVPLPAPKKRGRTRLRPPEDEDEENGGRGR